MYPTTVPFDVKLMLATCYGFKIQSGLLRVQDTERSATGSIYRPVCYGFKIQTGLLRVQDTDRSATGSRYRPVCYGFKIQTGLLRLPVKPRRYAYVKLNNHTLKVLSGFDVHSVTLTPVSVSISYSRETVEIKPEGNVGIDRNLDNVTTASTDETVRRFDLSKATRIKADYRYVKSRFRRNDSRLRTRIFSKYGEKQRNRVQPLLHGVSKRIVEEAKTLGYG